jgi:AraC-like DNA-binding protein
MEEDMEKANVHMENLSKGELLYRSLREVLISISRGGMRFYAPKCTRHKHPLKPVNIFFPAESHDWIEMMFCLKNRCSLYVNGQRHAVKPGTFNVLLPGDIHAERFYKTNVRYQAMWVLVTPKKFGFVISCYEPKRGYSVLSEHFLVELDANQELLAIGLRPSLRSDELEQVEFQSKLLELLLECLPTLRQIQNEKAEYIPLASYLLNQVKHYLDSHYQQAIYLSELGNIFHYSPSHLNLLFRKKYGATILQYILQKRIDLAENLLQTTDLEIKQVSYQVGFNDPLHFSKYFRQLKGKAPSEYRK